MKFFTPQFLSTMIPLSGKRAWLGTGNFCKATGNLLPAMFWEMEFIPVNAAILCAGTIAAYQACA
jgi:hypothetical protein